MSRPDPQKSTSEFDRRLIEAGIRSGGVVPLIAHDRKLGFLGVGSFLEDAFSEADQELLGHIANQIAIAVENALNFERARTAEEQSKHQSERLGLLLRINNAVVSQLDLRDLLRVIFDCLREVVHHDAAGILLYDHECNKLRMSVTDLPNSPPIVDESYLIPLEGSAAGLAFTSGEPVFLDRFDLKRFPSEFTKRAYETGIRSTGNVLLLAHGRKLGVLSVGRLREGAFTEEETELLCQSANQIAIALENALAFREIETLKNKLASEKLYLEDEIRTEHNFEELIGESRTFKRILKQVETVAPTDSAVLIRGETGTGKELLARAIHNLSARRERTLVKVNCAAIPMGLLESELFGHEKGAFTGAITQRIGRFELAHKGTLLLDEVGDIPLELQPKLLRVLQEQEFERLGSTRTQRVDVRLIAATNSDLEKMVADKKYRSDLYYRLNIFPITIPPLRERAEDIPALARFFTQKYARRLKKRIEAISAEAMAALIGYHWPGNVRELEHFIERAVVLTQGTELEVSPSELKPTASTAPVSISTLEAAEREHILRALEESDWIVGGPKGAAVRLGMKRTTLQSRMQKLGIERRQ
jgi:formate hydrogenlyase transcriptional activator